MRDTRRTTITGCRDQPDTGGAGAVTTADLDAQRAALLPRRDTLCAVGCVDVTTIVGVNLAIAINAASTNATANAVASQYLVAFR